MIHIFMRPKKSPLYLTLQANGKSWREAVEHLRAHGLSAFIGEIEPRVQNTKDDEIVQITLPDEVARTIVRSVGLST